MFTEGLPNVQLICTECALNVHLLCTECALNKRLRGFHHGARWSHGPDGLSGEECALSVH
jgi:hypothetical protein